MQFKRDQHNPILSPNPENSWEKSAVFNASVVKDQNTYHTVYRALSDEQEYEGKRLQLSTIGYAQATNPWDFTSTRQLLKPSEDFDKYGLEDPRITKIDEEYFIFYTALSAYPFYPQAIKVAVATFSDFDKPAEKHLVTPFNAKAMVLFPEKVNGKYVALLTVNTDLPPSKICLAIFDKKEDIWSQLYWKKWYEELDSHVLPLGRINTDQLEVGTAPVLTEKGWLVFYAHIQNYYDENRRLFGVEAVLLDRADPQKIIGRTTSPILVPEKDYEKKGMVANAIFPSGALLEKSDVFLYYGAADTTCCLAKCNLDDLFSEMDFMTPVVLKAKKPLDYPLLEPKSDHLWEQKAVFNPAAFLHEDRIHLLYRAMGQDNTSVFGHAISIDGTTIIERSEIPVYIPRAEFESKKVENGNSGCEDPRITQIGDTLYMCYTAYDGENPPRVAFTSITLEDFLSNKSNWKDPVLISPPGIDDKDAALFPEKIAGKYEMIHRTQSAIVLDNGEQLNFDGKSVWLRSLAYISPRADSWDSEKIGIAAPPIKTDKGWIVLYHGVSKFDHQYRVGALLLNLEDPTKVITRTPWPILEPEKSYEKQGEVAHVVFPCGAVVKNDTLFIYYGGADKVTCVATLNFPEFLTYLTSIKE